VLISAIWSYLNITTATTTTTTLWPCVYLAPLWRCGASKIMGSRPWPFFYSWWSTSYGLSIATMRLYGTVMEIWGLKDMYTDTHTDTQNHQSHNLLQCSLRSHLAKIIITIKIVFTHSRTSLKSIGQNQTMKMLKIGLVENVQRRLESENAFCLHNYYRYDAAFCLRLSDWPKSLNRRMNT